jgi:hypothetical protein
MRREKYFFGVRRVNHYERETDLWTLNLGGVVCAAMPWVKLWVALVIK